jgi:hypothetical protein
LVLLFFAIAFAFTLTPSPIDLPPRITDDNAILISP